MTQFPAEPSPGGVIWTVQLSEQDRRKMSTAELIRAFESRQITAYTLVSKDGSTWTQIGNVPHLVHAISTVVKRRHSTPPPSPVYTPAPRSPAPPPPSPRRAPEPPASAPLHLTPKAPLDSQVAVPLVTRNEPAAQLVDASDRDIATTPGVNRGTSTVTPFTVVAPLDDQPFTAPSRWSTARLALLGGAAAVVLFGVAMASGLLKPGASSTTAVAVQPPPVAAPVAQTPAAIAQAATAAPAPASAAPAAPAPAKGPGTAATQPVVLDFDSLPVDGERAGARTAGSPITLEAARKAMLEPSSSANERSGDDSPSTAEAPAKASSPSAAQAAANDPAKPPGAFDNAAARSALANASQRAQGCLGMGLVHTTGKVVVVFDPSGSVSAVNILTPEFAKAPLGPCLVTAFKQVSVPAFVGSPTAVSKTFTQ